MRWFRAPDRETFLAALGLVALVVVAYVPAMRAGFIWDDPDYVVNNPTLRSGRGLLNIWLEPRSLPQYYPLVHTTFWAEFQVAGLEPALYHVDNILLHALGAVLLWRVLVKLQVRGAWLAAAVFAVHPINVESVAWVTERKNLLSGVMYFAAGLGYLNFLEADEQSRARMKSYGMALGLFAAALLSKSVTCSLPAALLLVMWWKRGRVRWKDVALLAAMFVIGAAMALVTSHLEATHVGARGDEWNYSLGQRVIIAGRALWFYVGKVLVPVGQAFVYPKWAVDARELWQWGFAVAAGAAVVTLLVVRRWIGRGPVVAVLLFAGTALPALGFVNIYPMRYTFAADHYVYLAVVPVIVLVVAGIGGVVPVRLQNVVLIPLVALTFVRAGVFRDSVTLWTDTVKKNPYSWMVQLNLAQALAHAQQDEAAAVHFRRAVELAPGLPETHGNLAMSLAARGDFEGALRAYGEALKLDATFPEAFFGRGRIYQRQGRVEEAKREFELAVKYFPGYGDAWLALGKLRAQEGDADAAEAALKEALRAEPYRSEAHNEMGKVLVKQRDARGALGHFAQAVESDPANAEARMNLGSLLAVMGRQREAEEQVKEAVRLDPSLAKYADQALRKR
ncbi:MAG TPA: tetratricopeptide repeat protein [Tepidisphaeraceae bacterium]|jgi:tetratricopeptide (TPR) repeat protein